MILELDGLSLPFRLRVDWMSGRRGLCLGGVLSGEFVGDGAGGVLLCFLGWGDGHGDWGCVRKGLLGESGVGSCGLGFYLEIWNLKSRFGNIFCRRKIVSWMMTCGRAIGVPGFAVPGTKLYIYICAIILLSGQLRQYKSLKCCSALS